MHVYPYFDSSTISDDLDVCKACNNRNKLMLLANYNFQIIISEYSDNSSIWMATRMRRLSIFSLKQSICNHFSRRWSG